MSTLKKRTRLAAVATATLTGASIFALAAPANATAVAPEPISQAGSSATGGTSETITVKFNANTVGEAPTFYVAELFYFDSVNAPGFDPTNLPYYGGQTGLVAMTPAAAGVNTITFEGVPAGQYKVLIWAQNSIGRSVGNDGTSLWNGGRVPASPATDKAIEVSKLGTNERAPIPNFTAFRPYASWGDMLDSEYQLWTGHNKKGAAIENGRFPRDDEFTFWRYNLAVKNIPNAMTSTNVTDTVTQGVPNLGVVLTENAAELNNNGATPPVADMPHAITVSRINRAWPDNVGPNNENTHYNTYYEMRLTWLITDPRPGFDMSVPPKALSPHAPADSNNDGRLSRAEVQTAVQQAEDWAYNDVLFDRRETWAAWMAEEASQTDGPAIRLYTAYFDRLPDYGGLSFWSTRLRTGGNLLGVSEFFLDSEEFKAKVGEYDTFGGEGATDAAEFVALIYRNVLDREPDGSGFAFWTRQLQTERYTPAEVLIGFSEAHEFRDKLHGRTNAASVYAHLLGRVPTAKEYVLDSVYSHFFVDNPTEVLFLGPLWVSGYERLIDLAEYGTRASAVPAHVPVRD